MNTDNIRLSIQYKLTEQVFKWWLNTYNIRLNIYKLTEYIYVAKIRLNIYKLTENI